MKGKTKSKPKRNTEENMLKTGKWARPMQRLILFTRKIGNEHNKPEASV